MSDLNACLNEILTDENGKTITPECGIEKLLSHLVETVSALSAGNIAEVDGGYPDNNT